MKDIDIQALRNLTYGLFVLTSRVNEKDNGCIINVAAQVTENPMRITIAINKNNYSHDLILASRQFNLNMLTEETPMRIFEHFGFQSGRNVNKFEDCTWAARSANGILYLSQFINGYISGEVEQTVDLGSHTLFIAKVTEAVATSNVPSLTYAYYHANIKPKPTVSKSEEKTKWVCQICGYEYEGDELPDDFICPVCKHGKSDFVKVS